MNQHVTLALWLTAIGRTIRPCSWPRSTAERETERSQLRPQIAGQPRTNADDLPYSIVARESSELADRLRSQGWIARVGWRVTGRDDQRAWLIRFEHPAVAATVAA